MNMLLNDDEDIIAQSEPPSFFLKVFLCIKVLFAVVALYKGTVNLQPEGKVSIDNIYIHVPGFTERFLCIKNVQKRIRVQKGTGLQIMNRSKLNHD